MSHGSSNTAAGPNNQQNVGSSGFSLKMFLVCLLPVSLLLGTNFPFMSIGSRTLYVGTNEFVIILLLLASWGKHPFRNTIRATSNRVWWSIICFSFVLPLSVFAHVLKTETVPGPAVYVEVVRWFEYLCVLIIVTTLVRTEKELKQILGVMFVCFCILIAYSIYQSTTFEIMGERAYGLFVSAADREGVSNSNPNVLGAALMGSSLFFLAFASNTRTKRRNWLYLVLVLSLAALALTLSRSAAIAFLAGAMTMLLYRGISKVRLVGGIALSVVVLASLLYASQSIRERLTNSLDLRSQTSEALSAMERIEEWQIVLEQFPKNLWLGVGYGDFERSYGFLTPDNHYLETLATTGVVGLGFLLLMFYRIFARVHKSVSKGDPRLLAFRVGYLSSFVGLLVASLFAGLPTNPRLAGLFWLMTALALQSVRFEERLKPAKQKAGLAAWFIPKHPLKMPSTP